MISLPFDVPWPLSFPSSLTAEKGSSDDLYGEVKASSRHWERSNQIGKLLSKPLSATDSFDFAVLGDSEPGRFWIFRKLFSEPAVFTKHLLSLRNLPLDFMFQLGDMVSRGTLENYRKFFQTLSSAPPKIPYLTVIGNHDRSKPNGKSHSRLYRSLFGSKTNYFFDRGPARLIILDSSRAKITRAQLRWLNLALKTPLKKIVLTHMPPMSLRFWNDIPVSCRGGFKKGSSEFIEMMARHKVDRVYTGHIHAFAVCDYKGVRYVLTGGGGSPLFPSGVADKFYHSLRVSVSPYGIKDKVNLLSGENFYIPEGKVFLNKFQI